MNSPRAYGMNKSIRRSNLQTPGTGGIRMDPTTARVILKVNPQGGCILRIDFTFLRFFCASLRATCAHKKRSYWLLDFGKVQI